MRRRRSLWFGAVLLTAAILTPPATGMLPSGAGGKNLVQATNRVDGRLHVAGQVQLNRIPGPTAEPYNLARAYASCTGCQTLAVALQVNLIGQTPTFVSPKNAAVALNYECTGCHTRARAFQYVLQVDDPTQTPPRVQQLVARMNQELNAIQADQSVTLPEAEARVNAVVAEFQDLAFSLNDQRDETTETTSPDAPPPQ